MKRPVHGEDRANNKEPVNKRDREPDLRSYHQNQKSYKRRHHQNCSHSARKGFCKGQAELSTVPHRQRFLSQRTDKVSGPRVQTERPAIARQVDRSPSPTIVRKWRRDRDSNPGDGFPPTHFPGVRLRPLGHLSVPRLFEPSNRNLQGPIASNFQGFSAHFLDARQAAVRMPQRAIFPSGFRAIQVSNLVPLARADIFAGQLRGGRRVRFPLLRRLRALFRRPARRVRRPDQRFGVA